MKLISTILFLYLGFPSFCQTGKAKLDITITDTSKPYFLDLYVRKEKILISKITIISSGNYFINELKEGIYNFEFKSKSRKLYFDSIKIIQDSITNLRIVYPAPCKFTYTQDYKPVCPFNHFDKIVKIVYGYPSRKMMAMAKKGLIYLGGCIVSDCDPKYYCTIHKKEI